MKKTFSTSLLMFVAVLLWLLTPKMVKKAKSVFAKIIGEYDVNTIFEDDKLYEQKKNDVPHKAYQFKNVVFKRRVKAEEVLNELREILVGYGYFNVADLYLLANVPGYASISFRDGFHGWTNLDDVVVERVNNGFVLTLPDPYYMVAWMVGVKK